MSIRLLLLVVASTTLISFACGIHFEYTPKGEKEPCILMDVDFTIKLDATKNKKVVQTVTLDSKKAEKELTFKANCDKMHYVTVQFPNGVAWTLNFQETKTEVFLDRQIKFVPKKVFSKSTTTLADTLTFTDPKTWQLGKSDQSFLCKSKIMTSYKPKAKFPGPTTFSVTNTVENFQVQVFNLKNGKYSPSHECKQDLKNTTTPTPTTPTTTTTLPPAPDNKYYVQDKNITCIALEGKLSVSVTYEKKSGKGLASWDIPSAAKSGGSCHLSNNTQNLIISYFKKDSLEMIFQKQKTESLLESEDGTDQSYGIYSIILTYVIDKERFPNSKKPVGTVFTVSATGEKYKFPNKPSGKGFYVCKSNAELKLINNDVIKTSDFRFKAFNDNNSKNFTGSAEECAADKGSSHDHEKAIIIGAVVGGVVLIVVLVVIAVLCHKKQKANYEPIQ